MRITTNSDFAKRPDETLQERPKYFLIYEGEITEPMYFEGIISNRKSLSINQNISIISVLRSIEESSNSHPNFALKMAKEIQKNSELDGMSKEELLKRLKDYLTCEMPIESSKDLLSQAQDYIKDYSNSVIEYEDIPNVIVDIYKDDVFNDLADKINDYIKNQRVLLDFNEYIDTINLIVDRDSKSFKDEQYYNLVKECKENKIDLYVSNPCFEVWLLMHFEQFDTLDFQKLKENKRVGSSLKSRKYSEKKLIEFTGHSKTKLKFKTFINRVNFAIEKEKHYCEDLIGLKDSIGSNIGILLDKLRK